MSKVTHILVAAKRGAPMAQLLRAEAIADVGLSGDRYTEAVNRRSPDYQVTLIESESIEAFTRATGLTMTVEMPRRNIITRGVRLNDLCGKHFIIGDVAFEGLELCEPCGLFAKRTHREALEFFVGRGGLRARILSGGVIHIGDSVKEDA